MKHWNKNKQYRIQQWVQVKTDFTQEKKYWCQQQVSTGRFYCGPYTGFWFEHKKDAVLFVLKWS